MLQLDNIQPNTKTHKNTHSAKLLYTN